MVTQVFQRNPVLVRAMPVFGGLFMLAGLFFIPFYFKPALLLLILSLLWFVNYAWSRKTPFATIADDGLTLFPSPFLPRKIFEWETMMELKRTGPVRVTLLFSNGKKHQFNLFFIGGGQRSALLQAIADAIAAKGAKLFEEPDGNKAA